MKKKLEIPESVTKALKAFFDNREEQRKMTQENDRMIEAANNAPKVD